MHAALVYPHQLYRPHPAISKAEVVYLIEDPLFFSQYTFHRKKLIFHRASMKEFQKEIEKSHKPCSYIQVAELARSEGIGEILKADHVTSVSLIEPCDDWLERRVLEGLRRCGIPSEVVADPAILTGRQEIDAFVAGGQKLFFHSFYIQQRKRLGLLLDAQRKPLGGTWSFDRENRKKLPKGIELPERWIPEESDTVIEARRYVQEYFPDNYGSVSQFEYPVTRADARRSMNDFFKHRYQLFGPYEDAITSKEGALFHSTLTPTLNVGLLTPQEIVTWALKEDTRDIPLASREGFIRQVIGWREFMRMSYLVVGRKQRTANFWKHARPLPKAFYTGETGIEPVDVVIKKVLATGYCHHIERLMVLGNFMLLCELHPDAVYQWFMEMFIDAYDWVMVTNVYGMSQYADGGLITTKPYISGSNYILKMSDFSRGEWCETWDALYWRFIDRHKEFFLSNPRLSLTVKNLDRKGAKGVREYYRKAELFLESLT